MGFEIKNGVLEWYMEEKGVTEVVIPDGVTSIGNGSFSEYESITSVIIPNSVTSIGDWAFSSCSSLTSITIPDSVTSIGNWAFSSCSSLTSITIPDSVTSIGRDAFNNTKWLEEYPDDMVIINHILCGYRGNAETLIIPDGVTSIGNGAFSDCKSITSVIIPDSVTSIGDWAFCECENLASITIPDSVTSIGDGAFSSCSSLTSITIPDSVTSIGGCAFNNTKWFKEYPDDMVIINHILCGYKGNEETVVIPDGVTIGNGAFSDCKSITSVIIPDGVTSIGDWAFSSCSSLASITIPDSVTSIGSDAFNNTKWLEEYPDDMVIINHILCGYRGNAETLIIPDGVTCIGVRAFEWCTSLISVTISDSVTSIGAWAFSECINLTNIIIPDSVTSIGENAFFDCSSLENIPHIKNNKMRGACRMGTFLNPDNEPFMKTIRSGKYVDKTMLIDLTNSVLNTENEYICVSRPRRFGKSIAAKMLCAYYSKGCHSEEIFDNLEIAKTEKYKAELNNSNVIFMDIQWIRNALKLRKESENIVSYLNIEVIKELKQVYPTIVKNDDMSLPEVLARINIETGEQFIVIIDEWDCLFRTEKENTALQEEYIDFLSGMFKGVIADSFIKLAYITGILPIKKYGTQSALNNFDEYTMVKPLKLAPYVGFTEDEVKQLCKKYNMDFAECKSWYDGYSFSKMHSVYSPNSVMLAMNNEEYGSYWTETDTYEILKHYIEMNFNGLKDAIIRMLGGERQRIKTRSFQNDMTSVKSKDDVMTLLVHLGYLAYDSEKMEVYIPNREVAEEFENAVEEGSWSIIADALSESEDLLEATINGDADFVATQLDKIHSDNSSVLAYNNELSLSCAITIAYYSAQREYSRFRELPTGKSFADIVFIPRKNCDKPAMIIELKWDKNADTAIRQIKEKRYVGHLDEYAGNLLLVGINYDKDTKLHSCVIEQFQK